MKKVLTDCCGLVWIVLQTGSCNAGGQTKSRGQIAWVWLYLSRKYQEVISLFQIFLIGENLDISFWKLKESMGLRFVRGVFSLLRVLSLESRKVPLMRKIRKGWCEEWEWFWFVHHPSGKSGLICDSISSCESLTWKGTCVGGENSLVCWQPTPERIIHCQDRNKRGGSPRF